VEDDSHVAFCQKFPNEKGSVKRYFVVTKESFFSVKVLEKIFAHFHVVIVQRHNSMRNLTVWPERMNSL
jgi:hypothetical protein